MPTPFIPPINLQIEAQTNKQSDGTSSRPHIVRIENTGFNTVDVPFGIMGGDTQTLGSEGYLDVNIKEIGPSVRALEELGVVKTYNSPQHTTASSFEGNWNQALQLSDGFTTMISCWYPTTEPPVEGWPCVLVAHGTRGDRNGAEPDALAVEEAWLTSNPTRARTTYLASRGYVVLAWDERGQSPTWQNSPASGTSNGRAAFLPQNMQYSSVSAIAEPGRPGVSAVLLDTMQSSDVFGVRNTLDIFEVFLHAASGLQDVSGNRLNINQDRIGILGNSLGGVASHAAAVWSGKKVPLEATLSAMDFHMKAGGYSQEATCRVWTPWLRQISGAAYSTSVSDYTAGTFPTFRCASPQAGHFDMGRIISEDGKTTAMQTGLNRVTALTQISPRVKGDYSALMVLNNASSISRLRETMAVRVGAPDYTSFSAMMMDTTCPTLMTMGIDDEHYSIAGGLAALENYPPTTPWWFCWWQGTHHGRASRQKLQSKLQMQMDFFNYYLWDDANAWMETPRYIGVVGSNVAQDYASYKSSNDWWGVDDFKSMPVENKNYYMERGWNTATSGVLHSELSSVDLGRVMALDYTNAQPGGTPFTLSSIGTYLTENRSLGRTRDDAFISWLSGTAHFPDMWGFFEPSSTFSEEAYVWGTPSATLYASGASATQISFGIGLGVIMPPAYGDLVNPINPPSTDLTFLNPFIISPGSITDDTGEAYTYNTPLTQALFRSRILRVLPGDRMFVKLDNVTYNRWYWTANDTNRETGPASWCDYPWSLEIRSGSYITIPFLSKTNYNKYVRRMGRYNGLQYLEPRIPIPVTGNPNRSNRIRDDYVFQPFGSAP